MILTPRMCLLPAIASLVEADLEDAHVLGRLLGATVPENWPPGQLKDALPWFLGHLQVDPSKVGWLLWYCLELGVGPGPAVLVGSVGFIGPPVGGRVEVGYAMLPQFCSLGYATEALTGLVEWAAKNPSVQTIAAEADCENLASLRVLEKVGFQTVGAGREPGHLRFEIPPGQLCGRNTATP